MIMTMMNSVEGVSDECQAETSLGTKRKMLSRKSFMFGEKENLTYAREADEGVPS
jgi:hypothetical protein